MFIPAAFLYRAWISQFGQLPETRSRVYCCIDNILQLEDSTPYEANLALLYGEETLAKAHALINRTEQFFGLHHLGSNMEGSVMHTALLAAYAKVQRCKK